MTIDGFAAELDEATALAALQASASDPDALAGSVPSLLLPLYDLATSVPPNAEEKYLLGIELRKLSAQGIDATAGNVDPAVSSLLSDATAAASDGTDPGSRSQLAVTETTKLIEMALGLLPQGLAVAPGSSSPVGVFFSDQLNWDAQMWSVSTDGLDLVSQAISTGHLDMTAYAKVAQRLEALGRQGPWTGKTATAFLTKIAEGAPLLGKPLKLLDTLWQRFGSSGTTLPSSLPIVLVDGRQLPPQTFSFSIGDPPIQSVTMVASPEFLVLAGGTVRVELVRIGDDGSPPDLKATASALPFAGPDTEEAHRWLAYPEQQVGDITVHYDAGTSTMAANGSFWVEVPGPAGVRRVTGIDIGFTSPGGPVTLHWSAD